VTVVRRRLRDVVLVRVVASAIEGVVVTWTITTEEIAKKDVRRIRGRFCCIKKHSRIQGKKNAYHNINKVQNSFIDAMILNLIDIVVCVFFALYSSIGLARLI
jgi:hypothetical protein